MQDDKIELKETEPQEVVDCYVYRPRQPEEVVDCYIHPTPLPERLQSAEPPVSPAPGGDDEPDAYTGTVVKRRRRWHWLLPPVALVLAATITTGIIHNRQFRQKPALDDGKDSASSIVDVFNDEKTTIPRADLPAEEIRLQTTTPETVLTAPEIYSKVYPSTVIVLAGQEQQTSVGTGVILTSDGYIITNAHVIAGGQTAAVAVMGHYLYDAELVGYDIDADIAILKALDATDLPVAEFGDSDLCQVGDTVYAIGNPLGLELEGTMTDGILSAINRSVEIDDHKLTTLQTTAAMNNGNSGGPLINIYGQVIGINTLKMGHSSTSQSVAQIEGLGFALPISDVACVVNDILSTGSYRGTPSFGFMIRTWTLNDESTIVMVEQVNAGSAAEEAGICIGDVILRVDGHPVSTSDELLALRRSYRPGDTVHVVFQRGGQELETDITLHAVE